MVWRHLKLKPLQIVGKTHTLVSVLPMDLAQKRETFLLFYQTMRNVELIQDFFLLLANLLEFHGLFLFLQI